MKTLHHILAATFFATLIPASQLNAQAESAKNDADKLPEWQQAFSNLPQEKRTTFVQHVNKARQLFQQKRVFETIEQLYLAEKIFPDSPDVENLLGACQIEFRAFSKAKQHFERAVELSPNNPNTMFNLGELYFVTKNWEEAESLFEEILTLIDPEQTNLKPMRDLIEFKLMLCKLKLDKKQEAKQIADRHDYLEDSPFYYYAQAALAFEADNTAEGNASLARAQRVFRNPQILNPWQDTMMEFGYLESFYTEALLNEE